MDVDELVTTLNDLISKGNEDEAGFLTHIRELLELPKFLNEDLEEAAELFRFTTHDFAARTFIRTMAAEFEGKLFLLQQLLLQTNKLGKAKLEPEEIVILRGQTHSLRKNGEVYSSTKYLPFSENLLFTMRLVSRIFNESVFFDTSDSKWKDVRRFIAMRNRITHPKKMEDMHISEEEIDSLNRAQDWLRDSFTSVFNPAEGPSNKDGNA